MGPFVVTFMIEIYRNHFSGPFQLKLVLFGRQERFCVCSDAELKVVASRASDNKAPAKTGVWRVAGVARRVAGFADYCSEW